MATTVTPNKKAERLSELEERIRNLEGLRATMSNTVGVASPSRPPSLWLTNLLQGVTLVTVIAAAFWLGSLSGTVNATASKLDKLSDGVTGTSRDSVSSRMSVIETKLDAVIAKSDNK